MGRTLARRDHHGVHSNASAVCGIFQMLRQRIEAERACTDLLITVTHINRRFFRASRIDQTLAMSPVIPSLETLC